MTKPHIEKSNGYWYCRCDGFIAKGDTVIHAYNNLISKAGFFYGYIPDYIRV